MSYVQSIPTGVLLAATQESSVDTYLVVGQVRFSTAQDIPVNPRFSITANITSGLAFGFVQLYNLTDLVVVDTISWTGTINVQTLQTAILALSIAKIYEARIKIQSGTPTDQILLARAELIPS